MQRLSVTYRITLLLALLSTLPVFLLKLDKPQPEAFKELVRQRIEVCEQIAISCSLHLRRQDMLSARGQLEQFIKRSPFAASICLKRFDGLLLHQIGDHNQFWRLTDESASTMENVRVPLLRDGRNWGTLEVAFRQGLAATYGTWFSLKLFLMMFLLNGLSFALLLRRKLAVLDPGNAVPKRVRNTLDTIVGGVVVLDNVNRIVLANEAFAESCGIEPSQLLGRSLDSFNWRLSKEERFPWIASVAEQKRFSGVTVFLRLSDSDERCFVVNSTPLFDGKDKLAGAMVSFEDVTVLEQQRLSLVQTLANLEQSKEQIRQQNEELFMLATRDALTGAFNRRALFENFEELWGRSVASNRPLVCIMADVDHFKRLNDNHGHSVGDQVLRDVARIIIETVSDHGIAGRYGGEEFCAVLPDTDLERGYDIAESIRKNIATKLAVPYAVTTSVGLSSSINGATSFHTVLEQADKALYSAKHGGRNNVRLWHSSLDQVESSESKRARGKTPKYSGQESISYHAIASLHSALAYRDVETAEHCQRVAEMSVAMGRGLMPIGELYMLEISALLHDIGKIGIPDSVLLKPGRLTEEEWKIMEKHAQIGVAIVDTAFDAPMMSEIIRWHHCRWDGTRQPVDMPMGDRIPLGARIIAICDAYDAMVSDRVYRKGRPPEEAFKELKRCAGTQFDPDLVGRFVELQIGWRADSGLIISDIVDKQAIAIGTLTERTVQSFARREKQEFLEVLAQLSDEAVNQGLPAIRRLAKEIGELIEEDDSTEWLEIVPVLQTLIELCMTVQRAHIRDVGARSRELEGAHHRNFSEGSLLANTYESAGK